jgi:hypothetical protein
MEKNEKDKQLSKKKETTNENSLFQIQNPTTTH